MPGLSVSVERIGDNVALVKVTGTLDVYTFKGLQEKVVGLLSENRHRLVFDLMDLHYISSAGAGVMMGAATDARDGGGKVVAFGAGTHVSEVLELLGVPDLLGVVETREEALAAVMV